MLVVWLDEAEKAQEDLYNLFWNKDLKVYNNHFPYDKDKDQEVFNYWWLAHGIEVCADGYGRSGDKKYKRRGQQILEYILLRNQGAITNGFYDDMLWLAIGLLRFYRLTHKPHYKEAVLTLWEDIKSGWNDHCDGGICWKKDQRDYKNTPANAPAVILACGLYEEFGNVEDLAWAIKIYQWMENHLYDESQDLIWDGMNRLGNGVIDKDWLFTYCQGVYIGASLSLYKITKEQRYLNQGIKVGRSTLIKLVDSEMSMLPDEGDGDGGLFKGILVRYLGQLQRVTDHQQLLDHLTHMAETLLTAGKDEKGLYSKSWCRQPDESEDLSTQLSGVILFEQLSQINNMKTMAS